MKKMVFSLFMVMLIGSVLLVSVCYCSDAVTEISTAGNKILSAIMWFGYAISVGMVVFIGIKYMLGAADTKANMKGAIVGWLIGAFIVFGASTVIAIVTSVLNINPSSDLASQIVGNEISTSYSDEK